MEYRINRTPLDIMKLYDGKGDITMYVTFTLFAVLSECRPSSLKEFFVLFLFVLWGIAVAILTVIIFNDYVSVLCGC